MPRYFIHVIPIFSLVIFTLILSACAYTTTGKGFEYLDDNEYSRALPYFEQSVAENGDKTSALMAGLIYLSDYQLPRNIDKARFYYQKALDLEYGRYDQYLDYYLPLLKARIFLYSEDPEKFKEATDILRGERYSEFSPALGSLAKAYAFGVGIEKNLSLSRMLFERAVESDDEVYSAHHFAWWLSIHPDASFRDGKYALQLMKRVLEDEEEAGRASTQDTLAAVYAENGDFSRAVETQQKAIALLREEMKGFPMLKLDESWYTCRLLNYQRRLPWHLSDKAVPFSGHTEMADCK